MIIIMRFGENNVLCPKYIDILVYEFQGVQGRCTWSRDVSDAEITRSTDADAYANICA